MRLKQANWLTLIGAVLGLTGCLGGSETDGPIGTSPFWLNASAPRAIQIDGVAIAGPSGFCIDPSATLRSDDVRFALLGSCASLANSATHGSPRRAAILSVSIGPNGSLSVSDNAETLISLLRGEQGSALLANQDGSPVTVATAEAIDGVVIVQALDSSLTNGRQLEPTYWRGFLDLKGRVVTLNVFSLPGRQGLSADAGRAVLMAFVAAMRQANAEDPSVTAPVES